jgi:hypothetical protein
MTGPTAPLALTIVGGVVDESLVGAVESYKQRR